MQLYRRSLSICSRSATWLGAASERRASVAADTCVRRSKAGGCAGGGGLVGRVRRLNRSSQSRVFGRRSFEIGDVDVYRQKSMLLRDATSASRLFSFWNAVSSPPRGLNAVRTGARGAKMATLPCFLLGAALRGQNRLPMWYLSSPSAGRGVSLSRAEKGWDLHPRHDRRRRR